MAIKRRDKQVRALPSRSSRTSRGSIVHNLPGGIRLRESAGSIELLGEAGDDALEQLMTVAKQRFGTKRFTLLGEARGQHERLPEEDRERSDLVLAEPLGVRAVVDALARLSLGGAVALEDVPGVAREPTAVRVHRDAPARSVASVVLYGDVPT